MAGRPPYSHKPLPEDRPVNKDDQVLDLLNAVSQRLIASEKERAALKDTVTRLAARADRVEGQVQQQTAKIDKAAAMTDRIEEAIAQQGRMNRRLDKMHHERVQMIRKLERIEETVIETQEALHSKALVLLTDQNVAGGSGKPHLPADTNLAAPPKAGETPRRFWHSQTALRLSATAAVVVLGTLCGWGIYVMQKDRIAGDAAVRAAALNGPAPAVTVLADGEVPQPPPIAAAAPDVFAPANAYPGVLAQDDATLLARFENDHDALAAEMNAIEPATLPPANAPPADAPRPPPAQETPAASAAPSPAPAPVKEATAVPPAFDDFVARVKRETPPLAQRLKPDPSLPPAIKEFETRAFAGSPEAQHDLAAIYTAGHSGVKADYARAAAWFTEAAIQGIANARYNLGVLYHQGLGVRKDLPAAIGWYGAAAALGHPEAQYNLGIAHIEGIGTQYDPKAAATFFESAANGGVMEAAYNLGLIHENGLLGAINADRALYWYKKAADRGSPEAQSAMDQLVKSLGISKTQAQEYIARAASAIAPAAPPPASPAPAAAPPARRSQVEVESLRPEDKVSVSEVASYLPQMTENDLVAPAAAAAQTVNKPVKDRAIIAQIQEQLVRMGLYPGPADGVTGPQTEDAIRAYQVANNLPGDGRATEALLLHLLTNEMNATAAPNDTEYGSRVE